MCVCVCVCEGLCAGSSGELASFLHHLYPCTWTRGLRLLFPVPGCALHPTCLVHTVTRMPQPEPAVFAQHRCRVRSTRNMFFGVLGRGLLAATLGNCLLSAFAVGKQADAFPFFRTATFFHM